MITTNEKLEPYPGDEDALWTVRDLAARWKMSVPGIRSMINRDVIPSLKIGRLVRFDPQQIRAFERSQQQ